MLRPEACIWSMLSAHATSRGHQAGIVKLSSVLLVSSEASTLLTSNYIVKELKKKDSIYLHILTEKIMRPAGSATAAVKGVNISWPIYRLLQDTNETMRHYIATAAGYYTMALPEHRVHKLLLSVLRKYKLY